MQLRDSTRVREIFCKLIEADRSDHQSLLDRECEGSVSLRARVMELLDAHDLAGKFLESPTISEEDTADGSSSPHPAELAEIGTCIGPYKLVEMIGEGGFGVVFLAEQEQPVQRQVALKIIKAGMDTRQVVARFEAERQALAMMEHPNIARVFDGGATASGRPYFVMELVRGRPITEHCDRQHLNTRQRLELFIPVCRAIQHAHQKGIIHRDLKPSNILVTIEDGVASPKVIDFGIAKASSSPRGRAAMTEQPQLIGTPQYMSPEQAGASQDIDTRSDIYSLGVLLYQLLTGVPPFDPARFKPASYDEIRRLVREVEPPRPSTRLATRDDAAQASAALQGIELSRLRRSLRGDLDWIVMKAIEKDPSRRYDTAGDLAADVQRFLKHEPVHAGPPGAGYRLRKLARRHRVAFLAVASVMISLAVGLAIASFALVRARIAEHSKEIMREDAVERLWASYLAEARLSRFSGRPGQRFSGLAALQKAAQIRPNLAVRNEAIACMSVPDLQLVRSWEGQPEGYEQMAFSNKLDRYAKGDQVGTIHVYDTRSDAELFSLPGDGAPLDWFLAFSPNDRYLAAARAKSFAVWDLVSRQVIFSTPSPITPLQAVDFSPDSKLIAISAAPDLLELYELSSGRKVHSIPLEARADRIRMDHQGKRIAVSLQRRKIVIFSADDFSRLIDFRTAGDIERLSWNSDGTLLSAACRDRNLYVWDPQNGQLQSSIDGHLAAALRVEFLHSDRLLLSTGWDYTARLWDPLSGKQLLMTPAPGFAVQVSPDDQYIGLCTGSLSQLWKLQQCRECRLFSGPLADDRGWSSAISPDGRLLASASRGGIRIWYLANDRQLAHLAIDADSYVSLFFSSDGRSLFAAGGGRLLQWAVPTCSLATKAADFGEPVDIAPAKGLAALGSDGHTMVYDAGDGKINLIDLRHPSQIIPLGEHLGNIRSIAVSPDGKWAATSARRTGSFRVWDLAKREKAAEFGPSSFDVDMEGVAFSPDGRWFVGGDVGAYRFWEVGTWRLDHMIHRRRTHHPALIAFTRDGKTMATIMGIEDAVQLVDPATGKELATLEDPQMHEVGSLTIAGYGTSVAIGNLDHSTTVWDLQLICKRLTDMGLDW